MTPYFAAVTTHLRHVGLDELARVASALQTQVLRDFAPEWDVQAVVIAAPIEAIPAGFLPIIVSDASARAGADGFHRTRADESPYIIVSHGPSWSLAASHALLRMLANPSGSARLHGPSPLAGQDQVEYLLDVCAPCRSVQGAYAIDGVAVSDFCTRAFFARGRGVPGGPFSFNGFLASPLRPEAEGVMTWLADDGLIYQGHGLGHGRIRISGGFPLRGRGRLLLREFVDSLDPDWARRLGDAPLPQNLLTAELAARRVRLTNFYRYHDELSWRLAASDGRNGTLRSAESAPDTPNGRVRRPWVADDQPATRPARRTRAGHWMRRRVRLPDRQAASLWVRGPEP